MTFTCLPDIVYTASNAFSVPSHTRDEMQYCMVTEGLKGLGSTEEIDTMGETERWYAPSTRTELYSSAPMSGVPSLRCPSQSSETRSAPVFVACVALAVRCRSPFVLSTNQFVFASAAAYFVMLFDMVCTLPEMFPKMMLFLNSLSAPLALNCTVMV